MIIGSDRQHVAVRLGRAGVVPFSAFRIAESQQPVRALGRVAGFFSRPAGELRESVVTDGEFVAVRGEIVEDRWRIDARGRVA